MFRISSLEMHGKQINRGRPVVKRTKLATPTLIFRLPGTTSAMSKYLNALVPSGQREQARKNPFDENIRNGFHEAFTTITTDNGCTRGGIIQSGRGKSGGVVSRVIW